MTPLIIICLPGASYSGEWVKCFAELLAYFHKYGIQYLISQKSGSNIYHLRASCLGCDLTRGRHQKPFDNKINYDRILWIDSDIIFTPSHFADLYNRQKDIVAGLYLMQGGKQYAVVEKYDDSYLLKNGSYEFLTPESVKDRQDLLSVEYTGFGFLLVKNGVFESIEYPYFMPEMTEVGEAIDFCSEDVAFCKKVKRIGFDIWVDPLVKVGHQKLVTL